MTKYETVIKVLSQVDRETLEKLGEGFLYAYDYGYFLKYEDSKEVLYDLIVYFSSQDTCVQKVSEENGIYVIFGDIIRTNYLKEKQHYLIKWDKDSDSFNEESLSILNITECYSCEECETRDCCYENIFFIEEFYNYCLNQEFIKILIKELKNSDEKVKENKEKEERKEENMDNLRIIAENLVNNISKYEEIINNLVSIGVRDEKIYNIFYEILKDIIE